MAFSSWPGQVSKGIIDVGFLFVARTEEMSYVNCKYNTDKIGKIVNIYHYVKHFPLILTKSKANLCCRAGRRVLGIQGYDLCWVDVDTN